MPRRVASTLGGRVRVGRRRPTRADTSQRRPAATAALTSAERGHLADAGREPGPPRADRGRCRCRAAPGGPASPAPRIASDDRDADAPAPRPPRRSGSAGRRVGVAPPEDCVGSESSTQPTNQSANADRPARRAGARPATAAAAGGPGQPEQPGAHHRGGKRPRRARRRWRDCAARRCGAPSGSCRSQHDADQADHGGDGGQRAAGGEEQMRLARRADAGAGWTRAARSSPRWPPARRSRRSARRPSAVHGITLPDRTGRTGDVLCDAQRE